MHRTRRGFSWFVGCAVLTSLSAHVAQAGFTSVSATASPTHPAIFANLYGGAFAPAGAVLANGMSSAYSNGSTVLTRTDDDSKTSLLYILVSSPGNADDDLWGDGAATILATARYSEGPQEFGYNQGPGYVKLLEVPGGGFAATGMGTVIFNNNAVWQWGRADDSTSGPVNLHLSDEASNSDGLDHMVTYLVTGAPGVPANVRVWLLLFESGSDGDFNDLVIQLGVEGCTTTAQCDDGIACTFDICGPKRFCINAPLANRCVDNNICTTDVCDTLVGCVNAPLTCSDGNACTNDSCDPVLGCQNEVDDCDDGVDCTIDECDPVAGCANVPDHTVCDDQNDCTIDSCSPTGGCINANAPWGAACGNQTVEGPCDRPDVCDGFGACGPYYQDSSFECRPSAGFCDVAELCSGNSADCPEDQFQPEGLECRASEGICDVAEFCTGFNAECPGDDIATNTTPCRESISECDVTEFCTGFSIDCPGDGFMPADTPCNDDGDNCTFDFCDSGGFCLHPENPACGACCLPNDSCLDRLLPEECQSQDGSSSGPGTTCMGDGDGDGVDDLCDNCPGVDDAVFGLPICRGSSTPCETNADCGPNGVCEPACNGAIPTVSQWGLVILTLALLVAGKLYYGRRPIPVRA